MGSGVSVETRILSTRTLAHILRTAVETLLVTGGALLLTTVANPSLSPGIFETALFPIFALAILHYYMRLQLQQGSLLYQITYELLYSVVVGWGVIAILFFFTVWLIPTELLILDWDTYNERFVTSAGTYFDRTDLDAQVAPQAYEFSLIDALAQFIGLFTISSMFVLRLGKRLWMRWKRLRQHHLIWELTHTHLVLVVVAMALLLFFISVYTINQTISTFVSSELSIIIVVIATLVFTYLSGAVVGVGALLAILAPAALLSYWLSRPIVERLTNLSSVTTELSQGNYATRLQVSGNDEVSHLQINFNDMAATLQNTLIALKSEHDTLHHLLSSRRELFTNLSHELRTPIATMRSYLESLLNRDHTLPADVLHDIEIMHLETLHLQRLVDDFLLLTRAEEVGLQLHPVPTDITPLLERLAEATALAAWQDKHIRVIAKLPSTIPMVVVDELRLEQIIHNLMQNAVRHTQPGGTVALSAVLSGPDVVIQVSDTGSGIAPDDLPYIWQRFYRSASARQHYRRGAGLGLALVKELTEAMSGRVAVESTQGEGSTFMIWLPQVQRTAAQKHNTELEGTFV